MNFVREYQTVSRIPNDCVMALVVNTRSAAQERHGGARGDAVHHRRIGATMCDSRTIRRTTR
jgi:hypothetical protein